MGGEPQIGERVLDFLALEKPQSAVDAVRQCGAEQRMLEHARLRVRTVQHRHVRKRHPLGLQRLDLADDEGRFLEIARRLVDAQRLALAFGSPQVLAQALAIVADERVGRVQDMAVRAIILLELDHLPDVKIALQILHVGGIRAPEGVYALIVIADRKNRVVVARQQLQPAVLQAVGVLELVDQDVPEAVAVVLAQRLVARQQFIRAQQQLGEIDRAFALALRIIGGVELAHAPGEIIVRLDLLRAQALFLAGSDEPLRLARRIALFVEAHAFHQPLDERELILGVENLEQLRQAGLAMVHAQQPVAQAVKSTHPHAARVDRQHGRNAREHLFRRLVGESDGEQTQRAGLPALDQPCDARGEHARLAAAGAGQNERGLMRQGDGFELMFVEAVEKTRCHYLRGKLKGAV